MKSFAEWWGLQSKWVKFVFIIAVLAIIGKLGGKGEQGASSNTPASTAVSELPVESIELADLVGAFASNEARADIRFKKRKLKVAGDVESIGVDVTDRAYVTMRAGAGKVQFQFNNKQSAAVLERGSHVTIEGECRGMVMGDVYMTGCSLKY